jgi:hypothetical protein
LIDGMIINGMSMTLHSIREIERWLAQHPNDPQEITLTRRRVELEGELAMLRARQDVLERQRAGLTPPSKQQVDRIVALSNEVQELQRRQMTADLLLSITGKTLSIAAEVRDVGHKKPAPA